MPLRVSVVVVYRKKTLTNMTYKFTKDFPPTDFKKGDIVNKTDCGWSKSRQALLLATGIIEEVEEPEWPVVKLNTLSTNFFDDTYTITVDLSYGTTLSAAEAARDRIIKLIKEI